MSNYDHDQDQYDYDDDERFYEETAYNEEYYIERELEVIRQSNHDLELEELEEGHIREIGEEVLQPPVPIRPGESESKANAALSVSTPSFSGDRPSRLFAPVLASDEIIDHDGQIGGINRLGDAHQEAGLIIPI